MIAEQPVLKEPTTSARSLLDELLKLRRQEWSGRGKYVEPKEPNVDGLPELPPGWTWASPEQLSSAEPNSLAIGPFGSNLKVSDYAEEGVPLVFVRNIRSGSFGGPKTVYISPEKAEELRAHSVSPGDILVTKMGDPPGDACLYPIGELEAVITADCIKFRPSPLLPEPRYFVHAINSETVRTQILRITKGVAQQKISLATFSTIAIPLAPMAEQAGIVEEIETQLSRVDAGLTALKRAQANLKRYRVAILKAAFEGRLVPTEAALAGAERREYETAEQLIDRILGSPSAPQKLERRGKFTSEPTESYPWTASSIPGWINTPLETLVADSLIGLDRGRSQQCSDPLYGFAYVKMGNVNVDGRVDLRSLVFVSASEEERAKFRLHENDILFNTRNSFDLVGKVGLVGSLSGEALFNNNLMRIRVIPAILPQYLCMQMCGFEFRQKLNSVKKATTNVAAIYAKDLMPLNVALPPLAEQERIVAEIERRLSVVDELEATITANLHRATRLRQSILATAFSQEPSQ